MARPAKLPNFLIVGAAKCGTTSLYHYLRQHPDIFMPEWKELSFFSGDPFTPLHKIRKPGYYFRVFSKVCEETAIGEASTSYLYDKTAASNIKSVLGTIKIFIVLRDPVAMAYSLYNHQVRREGETINSFERALSKEAQRRRDIQFKKHCYGWHANYYYFNRGLYFEQVKRFIDKFGENNVQIIKFDDLANDAIRVAQDAYQFLGIDPNFVPQIKVHNPSGSILNVPRFWKDSGLFLKTYQFVLSKNLLKKIPHLLRNVGRKPPSAIRQDTAQELRKRFHEDLCRLQTLIKKDLSGWKSAEL